jgi:hypothetical protein
MRVENDPARGDRADRPATAPTVDGTGDLSVKGVPVHPAVSEHLRPLPVVPPPDRIGLGLSNGPNGRLVPVEAALRSLEEGLKLTDHGSFFAAPHRIEGL